MLPNTVTSKFHMHCKLSFDWGHRVNFNALNVERLEESVIEKLRTGAVYLFTIFVQFNTSTWKLSADLADQIFVEEIEIV